MPGPAPADPSTLIRRNKASTQQVIDASSDDGAWPALPPLRIKVVKESTDPDTGFVERTTKYVPTKYCQATLDWYADLHCDPQCATWLRSDRRELARLAILMDAVFSGRDHSAGAFKALDSSLARFATTLQDRWRMKIAVDRKGAPTSAVGDDDGDEMDELAALRATRPA